MGIIELDETNREVARIKVIGVGGAGGNALNSMVTSGLNGVEYIAINTDIQALQNSSATQKLAIGELGAGGKPEEGRRAIEAHRDQLKELLQGADMVFITAGMGGGTGTGASPVIGEVCRELGILSVAVVTKPFVWEMGHRKRNAAQGLEQLTDSVDTLITVNNQSIMKIADKSTTLKEGFALADTILKNAVKGVTDIIIKYGYVNCDFADVRAVMEHGGDALMGLGRAKGDNRAVDALKEALASPLLDSMEIKGSTGLLINFCASDSLTMFEVNDAMVYLRELLGDENEVAMAFGAVIDSELGDEMSVTIIATGANRLELLEPEVGPMLSSVEPEQSFEEPLVPTAELVYDLKFDREESIKKSAETTSFLLGESMEPQNSLEKVADGGPVQTRFEGYQAPPVEEDYYDRPAFLRNQEM